MIGTESGCARAAHSASIGPNVSAWVSLLGGSGGPARSCSFHAPKVTFFVQYVMRVVRV